MQGQGWRPVQEGSARCGTTTLACQRGHSSRACYEHGENICKIGRNKQKKIQLYHHVVSLHIGDCLHYDWVCYTGRHFRLNSLDVRRTPSGRVWSCSNFRSRHLFPPAGMGCGRKRHLFATDIPEQVAAYPHPEDTLARAQSWCVAGPFSPALLKKPR